MTEATGLLGSSDAGREVSTDIHAGGHPAGSGHRKPLHDCVLELDHRSGRFWELPCTKERAVADGIRIVELSIEVLTL